MENTINFIKKHGDLFTFLGLLLLCYFIFFFNIGNYALMDVDETRYVSMARDMFHSKDFLTLYLNGEYFFEKPPLYFWGECLSFALFGKVNEFTARFPVALYGTLSTLLVYFTGKKIISRRYGFISALILATTLEFVMLAKFAILDIVVTTCIGFSVMFGFLTQFVNDKNKKYMWWLFYIFSGLAVMAKGIPGFVVPFAVMFFVTLYNKTFKQIFKPQYILPGFALFFLIVLPWHIVMLKMHDPLFFNEYIMKHHINRFFSSSEIDREQPFYFYFVTVLWGLIPWVFSGIAVGITKLKTFKNIAVSELNNSQKFMMFNIIAFIVTMLFFSSSSTKLITYILPVYIFTAFILGFIWEDYIFNEKYKKPVNLSVYILGGICIFAAIVACFMQYYLPAKIYADVLIIKWFCIVMVAIFGISSILFALKNNRKGVFAVYALLVIITSAFGTKLFYNMDYEFGQNDLMYFAKYAKANNKKIVVLNNERKYSVLYYYGAPVYFISQTDKEEMKKLGHILDDHDVWVIVREKQMPEVDRTLDFDIILDGRKYSLVKVR
ncbi:TPA: phospholipid carrier-dependent glycosyltransferase [Candidatus Gastranaerophilales bacterium HUM_20]|nr:glycosyl transferase family 39 [Clostridium sp. CAG:729]DAB25007.1 MAG TPA: phospholipid carrier-dependent glycosyltransferase [Candidatus Gastranaerophilales bacterium HUM_20]